MSRTVNFVLLEMCDTELMIDGQSYPLVYALELGEKHCVIVAQCAYREGESLESHLAPLRAASSIVVTLFAPKRDEQLRREYKVKLAGETFKSYLWPSREDSSITRRQWGCEMRFEVQS